MKAPKIWIAAHPMDWTYHEISWVEPEEDGIYINGHYIEWKEYVLIETGGQL